MEKRKTILLIFCIFNILNQSALLHRKAQYFLRNLETVLDTLYYVLSYAKTLTSSNRTLWYERILLVRNDLAGPVFSSYGRYSGYHGLNGSAGYGANLSPGSFIHMCGTLAGLSGTCTRPPVSLWVSGSLTWSLMSESQISDGRSGLWEQVPQEAEAKDSELLMTQPWKFISSLPPYSLSQAGQKCQPRFRKRNLDSSLSEE